MSAALANPIRLALPPVGRVERAVLDTVSGAELPRPQVPGLNVVA